MNIFSIFSPNEHCTIFFICSYTHQPKSLIAYWLFEKEIQKILLMKWNIFKLKDKPTALFRWGAGQHCPTNIRNDKVWKLKRQRFKLKIYTFFRGSWTKIFKILYHYFLYQISSFIIITVNVFSLIIKLETFNYKKQYMTSVHLWSMAG